MKRFWLSWYQAGVDYRPVVFPPNAAILGWWHTGFGHHGGFDDINTLVALVEAESEESAWKKVLLDWPDMVDRRFIEERNPDFIVTSERFPLSEWMKPRMTKMKGKS